MPLFNPIAIAPTTGPRRKSSALRAEDTSEPEGELPARHLAPPSRTVPQPTHRFRVGERLRMGYGGATAARAASSCKVLSLLPYEGRGPLLYRVRSDTEAFERVVAEADLTRGG
jgi:hypothetical protein